MKAPSAQTCAPLPVRCHVITLGSPGQNGLESSQGSQVCGSDRQSAEAAKGWAETSLLTLFSRASGTQPEACLSEACVRVCVCAHVHRYQYLPKVLE